MYGITTHLNFSEDKPASTTRSNFVPGLADGTVLLRAMSGTECRGILLNAARLMNDEVKPKSGGKASWKLPSALDTGNAAMVCLLQRHVGSVLLYVQFSERFVCYHPFLTPRFLCWIQQHRYSVPLHDVVVISWQRQHHPRFVSDSMRH
jgi:hypothetical protein